MHVPRASRGGLARVVLSGALMLLCADASRADWSQTNGPRGGLVRSLLAVPSGAGTNLFAGQTYLWRTGDAGASWTHLTQGLPDPSASALLAVANGAGGADVFAGTNAGVLRSSDQGATWTAANQGIGNVTIAAMASGANGAGGTYLYAGGGGFAGKVFRSADNGGNWTEVSSGLPVGQTNVQALLTTPAGTVIAGTGSSIYRSTNFGASWTQVHTLPGLSLARYGSTVYAGTTNGVYRSNDEGATWTPINAGMAYSWVQALAAVPSGAGVILFANFMRSTDGGTTWSPMNAGFVGPAAYSYAFAANASGGTDVFAGTNRGVFRSSDYGSTWTDVSFVSSWVEAVEATPTGTILAGTQVLLYRTTDGGVTWVDPGAGTTAHDFAVNLHSASGVSLFAGHSSGGIYKSTDDGVTWNQAMNGLGDIEVNSIAAVPNGSGGTNLLAGTYSESFISMDDGANWMPANLQTLILDHVATPNGGGGHDVWAAGFGGVWLSTNYGTAWTPRSNGIAGNTVQGIAATRDGANLFAGGDPFGVYRSTDRGASWSPVNSGIGDLRIYTLYSPDGTSLFAAGAGGVYLSTDDGNTWTSVGQGLTAGVFQLTASAGLLYAGTNGLGVWKRPLSEMAGGPPPPLPPVPAIASFTPASGSPGTVVTITGSNFTGTSAVTFNLVASSFTVLSGTQIRATVPAGATTGRIRVVTPGGTATSASDFVVPAPPPPSTFTFVPPHDAWVRSSTATSNFGSSPVLTVKSSPQTVRSYLKFVISGVNGPVQSAKLRLRVVDAGADGGFLYTVSNSYAGTSTAWTESGLTWNNAPALGNSLRYLGSATLNTWLEVDVTSVITGNGTYSFAISGGSKDQVDYSSSEGVNPPQLVVVASGSTMATKSDPSTSDALKELSPGALSLEAVRPNPFHDGSTIRWSLPQRAQARLAVFDIAGRRVRILVDGVQEAGERSTVWDGRDQAGSPVGAGVYLVRLEAAGTTLARKLTRLD